MANRNLNINLMFQADTTAAMSNIQQLGQLLHAISTKTTVGIDGGTLDQAVHSAQQLQVHLQNAVNVNTGKLDLSKLNSSLKTAGVSLNQLTSNLYAAGPAGQQAFVKIATAIASAETPMLRLNKRLKDFGTTLANTAKWQIASSAIHGISGEFSAAIRHAEELNTALNEIRIVTGKSSVEMGRFAKEASSAARELSTTSTEYSKASLIFFQQGLDGRAVKERADVVVKLAQVSGQTVETTSDQLTAIWNNFDDGTKSLEYYADVLTKLGAETATSTDEIAGGLQKFAAVGETIGLSFEYASAALATITSNTRESEEVVGTALKTIFSRIQGLKLGETLEDGVDLNKYSEGLKKVGVDVIDTATGELRDMDDILDELGEKWSGLSKKTQTALAQTVAGVRQYNQFMALMNNWESKGPDDKDSFKANMATIGEADGELDKQAKIWSESWEAAAQRVEQSKNELYEKFLNDETITKLTDSFAELIQGISNVVDAMGGIGPLALTLLGLFSKQLFPMLLNGFTRLKNNISVLTGGAQKEVEKLQSAFSKQMTELANQGGLSETVQQQIGLSQKLIAEKQKLTQATKNMSVAEQEEAQRRMAVYEAMVSETQQGLIRKAQLEEEISLLTQQMTSGTNKRQMAEVAGIDSFQRDFGEDENIDMDAVVADATSTSMGKTKNELAEINNLSMERANIEEQIRRTQQSLDDHMASYIEKENTSTESAKNLLNTIESQEKELAELKEKAASISEEEAERKAHLEAVLELQTRINKENGKDAKDISVGKAETTAFEDNRMSRGGDVGALSEGMANQVAGELGGTFTSDGAMQIDASIGNLEKLYGIMGQYKMQLAELSAIEYDLATASQANAQVQEQAANATKTKENASKALKKAEEDLVKAENKARSAGKGDIKAAQALKKAKQDVAKAKKALKKAEEQETVALNKGKKAQQTYANTLTKSKDAIMNMAKAANMSKKDLNNLDKAFDTLEKGGSGASDAMKKITQTVKDLKTATQDTDNSLDLLATSLKNELLGAGINPAQLNALVDKLEEMGIISPDIANKIRMVGNAADEMGGKGLSASTKFMNGLTKVATAAGQLSMAVGAVQTLAGAFEEGNTPLETFSALLMGASMLIPIITNATKALAGAKAIENAMTAIGNKQQATKIALDQAEGIQKVILTAKTWLLTAAEVALKIAQNPILGAAILALIAASTVAIIASTSATEKQTEAQKELNEAKTEGAKKAGELGDKWQEQADSMDGLVNKYKQLKAAGEDYKATAQQIIDQVPDLIQAYRDYAEGVNLSGAKKEELEGHIDDMKEAAAAGDVEAVEAAREKADVIVAEDTYNKAKEGAEASKNAMAAALADVQGEVKDGKYTAHVWGADSWLDEGNEEKDAANILKDKMGGNFSKDSDGQGGDITLDTTDPVEFLEQYEKMVEARDAMESKLGDELGDSDVYREVNELIENDDVKKQYENLQNNVDTMQEFSYVRAAQDMKANGKNVSDIDSYADYEAYKEELIKKSTEGLEGDAKTKAAQAAEDWLEAKEYLSEYVNLEDKLAYADDKLGAGSSDKIKEYYDSLSAEDQKVFMDVDFAGLTDASQESLDKALHDAQAEALGMTGDSFDLYADQLVEGSKSLSAYEKQLEDSIKAAKDNVAATEEGSEAHEEAKEELEKLEKENKDYEKTLNTMAKRHAEMTKQVQATIKAYEDNKDNLDENKRGTVEFANACETMGTELNKAFGTDAFDGKYISDNLDLVKKAMEGDTAAIEQLNDVAMASVLKDFPIPDTTEAKNALADFEAAYLALDLTDLELGASLDSTGVYDEFQNLIDNAGLTAEQASAQLEKFGFAPVVDYIEVPMQDASYDSSTSTYTFTDPVTGETRTAKVEAELEADSNGMIKIPQINAEKTKFVGTPGNAFKTGTKANKPSGGGGGGGGGGNQPKKPAKAEKVEDFEEKIYEEEIDRYKIITEQVEDLETELDRLSQAKDEAWGAKKLEAMDAEIAKIDQLLKKLAQYKQRAKTFLQYDQTKAERFGFKIENNEITNYDEITKAAYEKWNSEQAALDTRERTNNQARADFENAEMEEGQAKWDREDAIEDEADSISKAREQADKDLEDTLAAADAFYESVNTIQDIEQQELDAITQKKEAFFEKLMYKIELRVELNERDLAIIDNKMARIEDDFYKTAEVMGHIFDKAAKYESMDEGTIFDDLSDGVENLQQAFQNGEITQASYIEGLGQIQDMAMENIDALYEMNSQMKEYYADVIDEGISKIQEMTDHFDHLTSKLQHYSSILSLMGHEQNYDLQNNLLQSQIDVLNDKIETSKATMAMLDSSLKSAQANYENATSEEDREYWKERIVQISQALNEEEDAYLGYVEEVGDAANQILTNSIEKAFKEAELSMTNNLGFDSILADMERMNTLTDEFLTNTNKMYETNKMISSAQLAIDKTQNAQAKQKYQDYIKYIEQLQVSGNLTQTELQTAQARYKVLEAEIALEEAKNAKSEVRLTRDSEGNFGYVYTANQDEVANATQNYLDAQNELYNVGLENTKAYREKTVQLQQSTLEELKQLEIDFRVDHIISEEQYNQQKAAILETSNALLETYTEQFNLAQFTMATTSYNALMEEDTNFYNGQLSRNKEHTSLMEANDTEYYNGIKTTAETTQTTLETNLANFNAGVLSKEDAQYLARTEKDTKYYTSLRDLADGKAKEIDGIFNTNEDSLANKLKVDFYNNLDTALSNCRDATSTWQSNMQPLVEAVGVSFDGGETGEGLTQKIANTLQESKDLKDYITGEDGLIKGIEKEWKAVEDATLKWQAHWDKIQEVIGAYDELIGRTQQLIQAQAGPVANEPQPPEDPNADSGNTGTDSGNTDNGGTNAVEAQASTLASQAMEIVQKVHNGTIKQDSSGWKKNAKAAGYSDDAIALALKAFNDSKAGGGYSYYYDKALELVQSYDTGGYTGEWGPEGRMAMLHEKELVLNAKDTENFLTATSMLREISQMLDNNALLASLGMINLSAMTLNTEADKVLQQEVTIHADFPNVTDHNEIEMAIDNLINAASQYANKK